MNTGRVLSARGNRGLAALIPTDHRREDGDDPIIGQHARGPLAVAGLRLVDVDPARISPNPRQPRKEFDPEALAELARSLVEVGMLQPIVVREVGVPHDTIDIRKGDVNGVLDGRAVANYELVAGERRLRAARLAGLVEVPAVVRSTSDDDLLRSALLENLQRVQLNALEEAASYEQLLTDFGGTHEELAARLGRSRSQISNTLRLLRLPTVVQRRVAAGVLSAGHARALLGLEDREAMERVAKRIVAEGLSVRAVEELVAVGVKAKPASRGSSKRAGQHQPELDQLAIRLSDKLETRVRVSLAKERGRITIEFAGIEDLHRVATALGDLS